MSTIPFRFFVVSVVAHGALLLAPGGNWLPTPALLSATPFTVQLGMAPIIAAPSTAQPADRDASLSDNSPASDVTRPQPTDRIGTVIAVAEPQRIDPVHEPHTGTSNNNPDANTGGRTGLDIAASETDLPERMPAIGEPQPSSAPSPAKPPLPAGQPSAAPASTTAAATTPVAAESITIPPTDSVADTDNAERTDTASHVDPVRVAAAPPLADPSATGAITGAIAARARREIEALLALRFRYPALARKHGWQGRVQVRITLSASGRIDTTQLVQSSGYRVLDRNALKTLRRIDRLPGGAQWLQGRKLSLDIPIRYRLING